MMRLNRLRVRTEGLGRDVESLYREVLLGFHLQLIVIHFSYSAQLLSFKGSGRTNCTKKTHIFSLSHANNFNKCSDVSDSAAANQPGTDASIYRPRHQVEQV